MNSLMSLYVSKELQPFSWDFLWVVLLGFLKKTSNLGICMKRIETKTTCHLRGRTYKVPGPAFPDPVGPLGLSSAVLNLPSSKMFES